MTGLVERQLGPAALTWPEASAFRSALVGYWGPGGCVAMPEPGMFKGCCPGCRSKRLEGNDAYPLIVYEAEGAGQWGLMVNCDCSEQAIVDELLREHAPHEDEHYEPLSGEAASIDRALFEDPQKTGDADGPARIEVPGSGGLCHSNQAVLFFSERGAGKSTVALTIGVSVAVAGGTVYYFDRENGAALTMSRVEGILEDHDWPDVVEQERFVGRHYPVLDKGWQPEAFGEVFAARGVTLVIYDSLREANSQLGGDSNLDADIRRP